MLFSGAVAFAVVLCRPSTIAVQYDGSLVRKIFLQLLEIQRAARWMTRMGMRLSCRQYVARLKLVCKL